MVKLGMYNIVVKTVVFHKNKVLLLKRSNYQKQNAFEWDIPGGRLEPGEDPNKAILRETLEEAGIKVNLGIPFTIFKWYSDYEKVDKVSITYISTYKSGKLKKSSEHEIVEWYDLKNLPPKITPWVKDVIKKATKHHKL
jgi:8-oxo-dGTP diphosphatase